MREIFTILIRLSQAIQGLGNICRKTYGSGLGLTEEDYLKENNNIQFVSADLVYQNDLIIILKMPELSELEKLRDGCSLFTMCHYSTRPANVELFKRKISSHYQWME